MSEQEKYKDVVFGKKVMWRIFQFCCLCLTTFKELRSSRRVSQNEDESKKRFFWNKDGKMLQYANIVAKVVWLEKYSRKTSTFKLLERVPNYLEDVDGQWF